MGRSGFSGKTGVSGWRSACLAAGLALCSIACESKSRSISQCYLPEDQKSTLRGYWSVTPIPWALSEYSFATENFTGTDEQARAKREFRLKKQQEALSAIQVWNNFTRASLGYEIFAQSPAEFIGVRESEVSPEIRLSTAPNDSVSCSSHSLLDPSGQAFVQPMVVHLEPSWKTRHENQPKVVAQTTQCFVEGSPVVKLSFIDVNTEEFFTAGKQAQDFKSIIIHELGHVLGLGHSCEFNSHIAGVPDCTSKRLPKDYRRAVMYPKYDIYSETTSEIRDRLKSNDIGRFNCLYPQKSN
ncbi:MAG: matrixin family metalloprotease [Bdellovibrionales bacterium]|nr:matrixin family metalloprotease [Bdellovibrionales bacterium]